MRRVLPAAFTFLLCFSAVGCGEKLYPVTGVVTLDGKTVEGATVTFMSADGKSGSGMTDASGNFTLAGAKGAGVPAGTYKVTIIKTKNYGSSEATADKGGMSNAYAEFMKDQKSAQKKAGGNMPPGMMPPPGVTAPSNVMSELPAKYATADTSGFSFTVPIEGGAPVKLELKSK